MSENDVCVLAFLVLNASADKPHTSSTTSSLQAALRLSRRLSLRTRSPDSPEASVGAFALSHYSWLNAWADDDDSQVSLSSPTPRPLPSSLKHTMFVSLAFLCLSKPADLTIAASSPDSLWRPTASARQNRLFRLNQHPGQLRGQARLGCLIRRSDGQRRHARYREWRTGERAASPGRRPNHALGGGPPGSHRPRRGRQGRSSAVGSQGSGDGQQLGFLLCGDAQCRGECVIARH